MHKKKKSGFGALVYLLLLAVIIIAITVCAMSIINSVKNNEPEPLEVPIEMNTADVTDITEPEPAASFSSVVENDSEVPPGAEQTLVEFLNTFYATQMNIPKEYKFLSDISSKLPDMRVYFDDEAQAEVWQNALVYLTTAKAIDPNDMNWLTASYTLHFNHVYSDATSCELEFYETSEVQFACLGGLKSKQAELECKAELILTDGQWKISSYYREEDFYLAIYREYENGATVGSLPYICDETIKLYHDNLSKWIDDRTAFNNGTATNDYLAYDVAYDRERARKYIEEYTLERNLDEWNAYDHIGGNCQNFASQVLYAGGIPMDLDGELWKYYSDEPDDSQSQYGRSPAWTSAPAFNSYARNNSGFGLVAGVDANVFSLSCGDLFQVGTEEGTIAHTNVVSGRVMHGDETAEILLNSNSNTRTNWPLTATYSAAYCGIVILGYNDYNG